MGQTGIGHQNMGQIFFGAKSARAKYEFGQICLGPTNYLRNWRWPIFLDQLLLGPNADNRWQALLSPRHSNCNSLLRNLSGTQQHGKETCSLKFMLCTCCRGTMADYEALTALIDVAGLKKEGKVRWWFNGIVMALMIMLMWNPQISVVVAHEQHGCLDVIVLSSRSQWWTPPLACLSTKSEWRG